MTKAYDEQRILEQQVREWTSELKRIAGQIAAARGMPSAIVMITPVDEDYQDVVPELIAEDALQDEALAGSWKGRSTPRAPWRLRRSTEPHPSNGRRFSLQRDRRIHAGAYVLQLPPIQPARENEGACVRMNCHGKPDAERAMFAATRRMLGAASARAASRTGSRSIAQLKPSIKFKNEIKNNRTCTKRIIFD
ncbi:hypothetical protein [Burkholderia cenocepacia]|uniref:hypothetical protein n=1 Tax=Burkholderia cenocepacia TaxID=95486 RepID=UPI002AB7CA82|nr:hypothetical protein [Burkholderia cenocepacia]